MNFKRCLRCGSFYANENNVCPNCEPKEKYEMGQVKKFLAVNLQNGINGQNNVNENASSNALGNQNDSIRLMGMPINQICEGTGVKMENINRFMEDKNFAKSINELSNINFDNNDNNINL